MRTKPETWMRPTRPGERTRRCERCGADYEPRARTQKFCDACRKEKKNGRR